LQRKILLLLSLTTIAIIAGQSTLYVSEARNQSNAEYRIKPGDVLYIKVVDSTYDDTVEVDYRGMIQIAFTDGDIEAAGKTVDELRDAVVVKLKKIFKNPTVEIRLLQRRT
jgi:protein involved in polysaccharide export with SLBB domain